MIPAYDDNGVTIYHGDCVEVMRTMPDNSVDSIVTDPPYGIRFMGKSWDGADIEKQTETRRKYGDGPSATGGHNSTAANAGLYNLSLSANQAFAEWTRVWAVEAMRILKPGGHMLVFCGSRTYHRMASGVEDAGFEIRDQIMWIYGSGFPKSLDISKAIDKAAGVEREVVGIDKNGCNPNYKCSSEDSKNINITAPATDAAKQWDGWGTALKPAHEPIVVARKPLIGTVAENVLKHGTGGINIDGGRIGTDGENFKRPVNHTGIHEGYDRPWKHTDEGLEREKLSREKSQMKAETLGRFPANIILDAEAGAILDKQSGCSVSVDNPRNNNNDDSDVFGKYDACISYGHSDSGGASRFFYCAKASKQDRDEGLESNGCTHPTVKPTALMQYLVRLVTPPGGTTYDPFMGSGSTGKAAVREGFKFIGSEREAEYIPIAISRINAPAQVELL